MSLKDKIKTPRYQPSKPRDRIALAAIQRHAGPMHDRRREQDWRSEDWGEDLDEPMQFRKAV
jgi:hypothetical protein